MTPPFSGFYKLNVDAVSLIEGSKWGIGVVICGAHAGLRLVVANVLTMRNGLKFVKYMSLIYSIIRCFQCRLDVERLSTISHLYWLYYWRLY